MVQVQIKPGPVNDWGPCFVAEIASGYRKGKLVVRGDTDIPQHFQSEEQAKAWLIETGYTVIEMN